MAILGFQLVTTLIGACILSKIVTHFSLARLLFTGLKRSVIPTDEQLLEASGNCKAKSKGKKRRSDPLKGSTGDPSDVFYFPRSTPIPLNSCPISLADVTSLPLYATCQWLLDFTLCTLIIYVVTEIFQCTSFSWANSGNHTGIGHKPSPNFTLLPSGCRLNLSLIWMILTVWFTLRSLFSITSLYFRSSPSGSTETGGGGGGAGTSRPNEDWFLIIAAGILFLLMAGFCLALDGRYFEFKLVPAYTNLTMDIQAISTGSPWLSWGAFHLFLALICAVIGALFVYPGMKYGRLYIDAISNPSVSFTNRMLSHLVFITPLFPICLWIKPFTNSAHQLLLKLTFKAVVLRSPTLLALITVLLECLTQHLGTVQLLSCLMVVLLRLSATRWNLQVYLDSAHHRIDRLNREPGKTSNREVQRLVASIFHCIHLVALQWIAPTFLLLAMLCLYKNTAGLVWLPINISDSSVNPSQTHLLQPASTELLKDLNLTSLDWSTFYDTLTETRTEFTRITTILASRGVAVSRGVLSFLLWWCLVALQSVTFLGLAYHRFTSV